MDPEHKIQQLELETVKAVTEMRSDIKNLANEVKRLGETIERMNASYVKTEDHDRDIKDLKQGIRAATRIGKVRALLYSLVSAVATAITVYEVMRVIGR